MSMHINAKPGDIAPNILLPGDPLRAKYMAENYLENAVCFNEIRGMFGYTGSYRGERVSIMSTGMGISSMLIYATELCREYGCKRLIRLGTAGAFKEDIMLGDIILSQATSTNSALNDYIFPGHFSPTADFELLSKAYNIAEKKKLTVHVGNTICNEHLYIDNKLEYSRIWSEYGVIASEMEGAALYTVAAHYGAKALLIASIVINLYRPNEETSAESKEKELDDLITLAFETVLDQK